MAARGATRQRTIGRLVEQVDTTTSKVVAVRREGPNPSAATSEGKRHERVNQLDALSDARRARRGVVPVVGRRSIPGRTIFVLTSWPILRRAAWRINSEFPTGKHFTALARAWQHLKCGRRRLPVRTGSEPPTNRKEPIMGDIGEKREIIEIEPVTLPRQVPAQPDKTPEPEKVPA